MVGALTPRPISYLTRSDVFVKPFRWILNSLNMIPVYRMRDGFGKLHRNEATFRTCRDLLAENKAVLIFPEGNQPHELYLRPLTKGTSRMALQSQKDLGQTIYIVPVGLNYFDVLRPRRKVILNFGKPISVSAFSDLFESDKPKALKDLRDSISEGIKDLLLIPEFDDAYEEKVKNIDISKEKMSFADLRRLLDRGEFSRPKKDNNPQLVTAFLGIFNLPAFFLIKKILELKVSDPQFLGPLKFALGLVFFPLWWIILFLLSAAIFPKSVAVIVIIITVLALFAWQDLRVRA